MALIGAVVVIVSRFLHVIGTVNAWHAHSLPALSFYYLPTRYPVIMTALAVIAAVLVIAGLGRMQARMLRAASYVGAYAAAVGFPLYYDSYRFMEAGFWLAIAGGALIAIGAVIAARCVSNSAEPAVAVTGPSVGPIPVLAVVGAGALGLVIVSLALPLNSLGSAWTISLPTHYPVVITVLAALALALVVIELANTRLRALGMSAIACAVLLGVVFPLTLYSYVGLKAGFWLGVAGALLAVVATAGPRLLTAPRRR